MIFCLGCCNTNSLILLFTNVNKKLQLLAVTTSPLNDENEISLYIILVQTTYLFKHSSDKNKESDHQG